MRTSIEIVQQGTETPPTFWRLPDRCGGDNCLGPALGFHAFIQYEHKGRPVYRSLCRWESKRKIGFGTRVGRPPVNLRCKVCDVEEQKLHMSWTPLPATEPAPDFPAPKPRKPKGGDP